MPELEVIEAPVALWLQASPLRLWRSTATAASWRWPRGTGCARVNACRWVHPVQLLQADRGKALSPDIARMHCLTASVGTA